MKNRKDEIIKATLELAAENGLGTVSMQQIANRVGITKASLYNHFSSREEIIEEMYKVLRNASKARNASGGDLSTMIGNHSLKDILTGAVFSYKKMVEDPEMFLFYKIIMSERSINSAAADILVKETQTMINATKSIFYALQVKGTADFADVDAAAFSFTMAVHAIIEYEMDIRFSGGEPDGRLLQGYIEEFCRLYAKK